jgi:DNA-binding NtrC family response regulator
MVKSIYMGPGTNFALLGIGMTWDFKGRSMTNGKRKILVVDDEPHQLETVCRGLFLYNYEPVGVSSADAALEALNGKAGDSFDLMLTDLTMPDGSGLDLIKQVQAQRSEFPIIVITGLAASEEVDAVRGKGIPILQKPFAPDGLDQAIREIIGE